jgi:hypothetical protein
MRSNKVVVTLKASAYAHQDILSGLFLALRDGVRRGIVTPDGAADVMNFASGSDCRICKLMLERLLQRLRG